jgi:hypothetical protein
MAVYLLDYPTLPGRPISPSRINWASPQARGLGVLGSPAGAGINFRDLVTGQPSTLSGSGQSIAVADPGHGLMFDPGSTDSYAAFSYTSPSTNTATISAWFYARTHVELATVVAAFGTRFQGLIINRAVSESNRLTYVWDATADEYDASTGLLIPLNTMCFGVVSVTPTAATVYLVYHGFFGSFTNTKTHNAKTMSTWAIGDDVDISGRTFDGLIGEWRVYPQRAWTDQDVREAYALPTRWDLYWQPGRRVVFDVTVAAPSAFVPGLINAGLINRGLINGGGRVN